MFRPLNEIILVSPQIDIAAIADARAQGVTLIINNRPDDEDPGQLAGAEVERAALAAGLDYVAIPITHSGFSQPQIDAMVNALDTAKGKVLAYCRSGTRSTYLWALAESRNGEDGDKLTDVAANAGYDISGIRPMMDMLKAQA